MRKTIVLVWLLLGIPSLFLFAQAPLFKHYNVGKKNTVKTNAIIQDQVGYIWLATNHGLYRYDDDEGSVLIEFPDSIEKNVTALAIDPTNRLWIGHKNGHISQLVQGVYQPFEPEEGNPTATISSLKFDALGRLWIATHGEGIYYWTENRLYNIDDLEGLSDVFVYEILILNNDSIGVGTDGGINIISMKDKNAQVVDIIDTEDGLPDNIVTSLTLDNNHTIWVGTESNGVVSINLATKKIKNIADARQFDRVSDLIFRKNQLWIASEGKNIIYDIRSQQFTSSYQDNKDFNIGIINDLYEDSEKGVWIVGSKNIARTTGNEIERWQNFSPYQNKNVAAITVDQNNNLWYATSEGLFKRSFVNGEKIITPFPIKERNDFISLYTDQKGKIWAGTYGNGLMVIDPISNTYQHIKDQLPNGNIIGLSGNENSIWLATLGGVTQLDINDQTIINHYDSKKGLSSDFIYHTFIDSKDRTWLATDGKGAEIILPNQSIQQITRDKNIPAKVFYSFAEDRLGNIWMNTLDYGLYKFDGENFTNYGLNEGLKSLQIRGLITDKNGDLMIANSEGLQTYDANTNQFTSYGSEFGIHDMYPYLNAITINTEDEIFIGTENGIIKCSPTIDYIMDRSPQLSLIDVKLFNEPIPWKKQTEFSFRENNFKIEYKVFWFRSHEKLMFRYRLEGHDQEWINTKNNQITYSNLSPGCYQFKLQVASDGDYTTVVEENFSFTIHPPFWTETWFITLVILTIAFLFYLFLKQREKNLLRQQRELEIKVEERTKEVLAQKDKIEKQHHEIVEKTNSISESINYSKRIQNAIIPSLVDIQKDLQETFMFYKPKDIVSGDFPYYHKKENYAYYAAVDCTGHGVPGAMMSLIGHLLLNDILNDDRILSSAEVLKELHSAIVKTLKQTSEDSSTADGMDIALCRIDLTTNNIQYAGANRPLYHVSNGELIQYKGDKFPIGGNQYRGTNSYTNHEVEIMEGDAVFFFSDGYQDQFGGPKDKKYGPKRIRIDILDNVDRSSTELKKLFEENYLNWMGKAKQIDDVLLIGIKF